MTSSLTKSLTALMASALFMGSAYAAAPRVEFTTTEGPIVVQLNPDRAPQTVKNFLQYVNDGFYKGTIFHRVIGAFMIQGGGFTEDLTRSAQWSS